MGVVNFVTGKLKGGFESAEGALVKSPEEVKAMALSGIQRAKETMVGSGSISTEIGNLGRTYLDVPIALAAAVPKAAFQILKLQPIELTKTAFDTARTVVGDVAKICAAPIPMGLAAARTTLDGVKTVAGSPLRAGRAVKDGCGRVLKMLEETGEAVVQKTAEVADKAANTVVPEMTDKPASAAA